VLSAAGIILPDVVFPVTVSDVKLPTDVIFGCALVVTVPAVVAEVAVVAVVAEVAEVAVPALVAYVAFATVPVTFAPAIALNPDPLPK
jgi:hypothetical protein